MNKTREALKKLIPLASECLRGMRAENDPRALKATNDLADARDALRDEDNWVDKLYEVRAEPDKLLIMITNRHYEIHRDDLPRVSTLDEVNARRTGEGL
jgi:hypothetical protein